MAEAGRPASADPLALIEGLLNPIRRLVGEEAGSAMFHFAAVQEGRRLAEGHGPKDLALVLRRLDDMLGQQSEILLVDPARVRLLLRTRPLDDEADARLAILLGLLEGAIGGLWHRPTRATVAVRHAGGHLEIDIQPEGSELHD